MRKILSFLCTIVFVLGLMSTGVQAAEMYENRNTITFEDGSYIEIIIEDISTRANNTKNGYKTYSFYDSQDNLEWQAKLSASFTYDGTTSNCTSASCTVTVYDSKWYEVSNNTTRSGNTATTALTMGQKFLGVTISKPEYTITLTCDKDGNLS